MENKVLYNWLEKEWRISNHAKYQYLFKDWVKNLTEAQIKGFNKMRVTKL
jgi:hypothetical protein